MSAEAPRQEATEAVSHRRYRLPIRGGNDEGTVEATCGRLRWPKHRASSYLHKGLGSISLWRDFPRELFTATGRTQADSSPHPDCARNDPFGTQAQPALAERMIPGGMRTVMLDCGHAPHLEAAAATIDAIAEFRRGTNAGPF